MVAMDTTAQGQEMGVSPRWAALPRGGVTGSRTLSIKSTRHKVKVQQPFITKLKQGWLTLKPHEQQTIISNRIKPH